MLWFYSVVYDTGGKTFIEWAQEFNAGNVNYFAEARANCVVLFKRAGVEEIYN